MSQENVEMVRDLAEAFQRGNIERAYDFYDPDIEWDASRFVGVIPDLTGIYHGHDAIRDFWQRWLEAWRDLRFEIEDIRDADDDVVLLIGNQRQWGRSTGIETDAQPYAWVFTFRGDRIVRAAFYPTHDEALEAAGLRE